MQFNHSCQVKRSRHDDGFNFLGRSCGDLDFQPDSRHRSGLLSVCALVTSHRKFESGSTAQRNAPPPPPRPPLSLNLSPVVVVRVEYSCYTIGCPYTLVPFCLYHGVQDGENRELSGLKNLRENQEMKNFRGKSGNEEFQGIIRACKFSVENWGMKNFRGRLGNEKFQGKVKE